MNKIFYGIGAAALVLLAAIILSVPGISPKTLVEKKAEQPSQTNKNKIIKGAPKAFGSLSALNVAGANGLGGGGAAASKSSTAPLASGMERSVIGGGAAAAPIASDSSSMIMPPFEYNIYKYVYKGDPIELKKDTLPVYKRIKGLDINVIDSLIGNLNLSLVDLSSLKNAKLQNFTITENKDYGLSAYVDLNEGNIYISEDWNKWRNLEMEKCADEQCFAQFRLKYEDVPSDDEILALANDFTSAMKINLEGYGQGAVDNAWKKDYERTADKTQVYIPEAVSVVYPYLIDGIAVKDQGGNDYGLRVNVNVRFKKASGVSALTPNNYESSDYAIETDPARVLKLAENGGSASPIYYAQDANAKTVELELGTPVFAYVQTWDYKDSQSIELMVPALVFPITKEPDIGYIWQKNIVVPLVKEMIDKLFENNSSMPKPRLLEEPATAPLTETKDLPAVK